MGQSGLAAGAVEVGQSGLAVKVGQSGLAAGAVEVGQSGLAVKVGQSGLAATCSGGLLFIMGH